MEIGRGGTKRLYLLVSLLLILLGYVTFGFYYGWIDDVINTVLYRGLLSPGPTITAPGSIYAFPHPILAGLITFLYGSIPHIAWYGLIMYFLLAIAFISVGYVIQHTLSGKVLASVLVITMVFVAAWLENFVLFTYTGVGVLLTGSGYILLTYNNLYGERTKMLNAAALLLIFCGLNGRFQSGSVCALLGLAYYGYVWITQPRLKWQGILPAAAAILIGVALFGYTQLLHFDTERQQLESVDNYNFTLNDAGLVRSSVDSLVGIEQTKHWAIVLWYFGDKESIDLDTWKSFTFISPFQKENLVHWKHKFRSVKEKALAFQGWHNSLNWYSSFLMLLSAGYLLGLGLVIYFLVSGQHKRSALLLGFLLWFAFMLVFIILFVKMEYRLAFPLVAIFFTMITLEFLHAARSWSITGEGARHHHIWAIALVCLPLFITRTPGLYRIGQVKTEEIRAKRHFVSDLNTYRDQSFQLGHLAILALHDSPFRNVYLEESNEYIAYGEYWLNYIDKYEQYVYRRCGSDSYISTMKCLCDPEEDFIFVYLDVKMDFITRYLRELYGYDVAFEIIPDGKAVEAIDFSFFSFPMNLHYYRVKHNNGLDTND